MNIEIEKIRLNRTCKVRSQCEQPQNNERAMFKILHFFRMEQVSPSAHGIAALEWMLQDE
jgi:hypothetical protein